MKYAATLAPASGLIPIRHEMSTLTSFLLGLSADALASTSITSLAESPPPGVLIMSDDRPDTPTAADTDKSQGTRDNDS
eukprot:2892172-Pyramimonas_sp.AAC.1